MKSKVQHIISYLKHQFPLNHAESWDKVGHQFGDPNLYCEQVIVALDLTKSVFDLAIAKKAQLIVVHHPFLFEETKTEDIAKAPYKANLIERLENTGINLLVLHTNYDLDREGMTKQVVKALNFTKIIKRFEYGALVQANHNYTELEALFNQLKIPFIQNNCATKEYFEQIAIIPGAASNEEILKYKEADLVITSDIKWSTWVMAKEENINLIEVPHYIEEVFVSHLTSIIKKTFKTVKVDSFFINKNI